MAALRALDERELIKGKCEESPETVVLVGNGALINGWMPLRQVLDDWILQDTITHDMIKKLRIQNTEALNQLATLSYKFKIARGLIFKQWMKKVLTAKQLEQAGLSSAIAEFLHIRQKVGHHYRSASDHLSLICEERTLELIGEEAVYITTNWDNSLWMDSGVKRAIYLHGRCEHVDSLVFPTELIIEDIAYDCEVIMSAIQDCSDEFQKTILSTFRCTSVDALLSAHSAASRHIHQARRLIIWGYSLGDFDADINALLGTNINREMTKELIVINTDPYAFQRAVALTGIHDAYHYNPFLGSMLKLHHES